MRKPPGRLAYWLRPRRSGNNISIWPTPSPRQMEPRDMSIFSSIMNKIFHHGSSSPTSAGGSGAQVASAAAPPTASGGTGAGGQTVDVEAVLSGMESNAGQKLDWRHSIVDLMKLLNLDSSLSARKELAQELHYTRRYVRSSEGLVRPNLRTHELTRVA